MLQHAMLCMLIAFHYFSDTFARKGLYTEEDCVLFAVDVKLSDDSLWGTIAADSEA